LILGRDQDQGAAAIGHQPALQQAERIGDHPRVQHIIDSDRSLKVARGFFAADSRCTTGTIANCSSVYCVVPAQAGTQCFRRLIARPGAPLSPGATENISSAAPGS